MGKLKTIKLERIPVELSEAAQGVTFWMGHRRSYYRHHDLTEGAIVAELCNILAAKMPSDAILKCEVPYREMVGKHKSESTHVDMAVYQKNANKETTCIYVIEVKRASAVKMRIDGDIRRLSSLKRANRKIRTFMLITSEGKRPRYRGSLLVADDGKAGGGILPIADSDGEFKVREVKHATAALEVFGKTKSGELKERTTFWCCVVEVF